MSGHSISLIRDPARGTSQLYLSVVWTSAFKKFFSIHNPPLPSIQSWGDCCFLQVARTAAQDCMERKWLNVRKALCSIMSVLILSAIEHFCLRTSDKPCLGEGGLGGGGGDVLMQANEQTEIGPGNKSLKKWLLVSNPRAGTNHKELIWTCFFFFLQLSICERRKPTNLASKNHTQTKTYTWLTSWLKVVFW